MGKSSIINYKFNEKEQTVSVKSANMEIVIPYENLETLAHDLTQIVLIKNALK